ncbi:AtpZ/AtpI family protein [Kaarinaea lacus]
MTDDRHEKLQQGVQTHAKRIKKAEQESHTVLAYTTYIGTLGLVFVLPVIGGAYLGRWLDSLIEGYSIRWTISMLFLGIIIGAMNVYFLVRTKE